MFDKLVESTRNNGKGRGKFFVATSLIYGFSLLALAVLTIIWANPTPVEAYNAAIMLAPPPVPPAPAPLEKTVSTAKEAPEIFIPPVKPPDKIMEATKVTPRISGKQNTIVVPGGINAGGSTGPGTGVPLSFGDLKEAPPPPAPTPVPTPKATPTPAPTPEAKKILPVTSTMLQSKALRKIQPAYPTIAKTIKAQGAVPVQITISEEGTVIEATPMGGHPTLRDAARQAALQWVFSPTVLNGKPMKVTGIISFNFILN